LAEITASAMSLTAEPQGGSRRQGLFSRTTRGRGRVRGRSTATSLRQFPLDLVAVGIAACE
jgi:hypothetical protein